MINSQVISIKLLSITIPEWYVRKPVEKIEQQKLKHSIQHFGYGIIIVRNENYELLDGRKRLAILKELKIEKIDCIWYPELSDIDTLVLIRNLHHEWSQTDVIQFSELLNLCCTENNIKKLAHIMPENEGEIRNILKLLDFDWKQFEQKQKGFGFTEE